MDPFATSWPTVKGPNIPRLSGYWRRGAIGIDLRFRGTLYRVGIYVR